MWVCIDLFWNLVEKFGIFSSAARQVTLPNKLIAESITCLLGDSKLNFGLQIAADSVYPRSFNIVNTIKNIHIYIRNKSLYRYANVVYKMYGNYFYTNNLLSTQDF